MDERFIIRQATVGDLGCVSVPSVSGPPEVWTRSRARRCRGDGADLIHLQLLIPSEP